MSSSSPSLALALTKSLREADFRPRDHAAVALAKRYAAIIEAAEMAAAELAAMKPDDESQAEAVARLAARVETVKVLNDLGPKLLAVLAALGMTPASRTQSQGGGVSGVDSGPADALARLRTARARG